MWRNMQAYKFYYFFSVFEKVSKATMENKSSRKYDIIERVLDQMINKMMPMFGIMFSVLYFSIGIYKTEFPNLEKLKICRN